MSEQIPWYIRAKQLRDHIRRFMKEAYELTADVYQYTDTRAFKLVEPSPEDVMCKQRSPAEMVVKYRRTCVYDSEPNYVTDIDKMCAVYCRVLSARNRDQAIKRANNVYGYVFLFIHAKTLVDEMIKETTEWYLDVKRKRYDYKPYIGKRIGGLLRHVEITEAFYERVVKRNKDVEGLKTRLIEIDTAFNEFMKDR